MPWRPGDPWPSTTKGGACSPWWSGYVRLWVMAAIGAGNPFHIGQHNFDRLDAGNVLTSGTTSGGDILWVDISCDVVNLELVNGAERAQGIFTKPDAATATVTIADPNGWFDPLAPGGPYAYGGRSRLVPGAPIQIFAEIVDGDDATVTTEWLFTGTADSWYQDWTANRSQRQTTLIASDATKNMVRLNRPALDVAVGDHDPTDVRIHRIVDYFGWLGGVIDPPGAPTATLTVTAMGQSMWELLNRTLDDELGYIYVTTTGELRWLPRSMWTEFPDPVLELGCVPETVDPGAGFDILVDATPSTFDAQMRNIVYAARTGGTSQTARSNASVERYGPYEYQRTDLGLADSAQAGAWAAFVVQIYAYPQTTISDVVMRPDIAPKPWEAWAAVLGIAALTDLVRIRWAPPDLPDHLIDVTTRVVGAKHTISYLAWEVGWQLVAATSTVGGGAIFTLGPSAQDRLDSAFVLA